MGPSWNNNVESNVKNEEREREGNAKKRGKEVSEGRRKGKCWLENMREHIWTKSLIKRIDF